MSQTQKQFNIRKKIAKQILEVMLMNDAPIGSLTDCSELDWIRDGEPLNVSPEDIKQIRQEYMVLRNIYQRIDITKLDEETGKSIVEKCKPLVEEFFVKYLPLFDKYIESGFQPQEVPQRLFEIRDQITIASREYNELEANKLYVKAMEVSYFSHNLTRAQWFIYGKPTKIHPEKLKLVLEDIRKD